MHAGPVGASLIESGGRINLATMEVVELTVGVRVVNLSAREAAALASSDARWKEIGALMRSHQLVVLGGGAKLSMAQLRSLNEKMHMCLGLGYAFPAERKSSTVHPPGYPEVNVLGNYVLEQWHGLSGVLEPRSWWEKTSIQFHHDGGFSARSPLPPAIVQMYCEVAPQRGGATLFFSTRLDKLASELVERARRMTCYYSTGFGRVQEGVYPIMRPSGLVPQSPPTDPDGETRSVTDRHFDAPCSDHYVVHNGIPTFRHALVQDDAYVMVHAVALDYLVEDGRTPLSWSESMAFLEALLLPATANVLSLNWKPGDVAFFDNRSLQHSVTPTQVNIDGSPAYVARGELRLMTRAHLEPKSWAPTLRRQNGCGENFW